MTYAIYADDQYVDDLAPARGLIDTTVALTSHEPDHPLTKFLETFIIEVPADPMEAVDQFIELQRFDLHVGEPIDTVIAQLLHALEKAHSRSPRTITISDGLGDNPEELPPPPKEQSPPPTEPPPEPQQ